VKVCFYVYSQVIGIKRLSECASSLFASFQIDKSRTSANSIMDRKEYQDERKDLWEHGFQVLICTSSVFQIMYKLYNKYSHLPIGVYIQHIHHFRKTLPSAKRKHVTTCERGA